MGSSSQQPSGVGAGPGAGAGAGGGLVGAGGRVCVIFNPAARGEKARGFRAFLESLPTGVELRPTTGPGVARMLAREAVEAGFERVIAAGGDGTVFEVLNGMADVPDGFERAALGVLPLGTANVFAHELGLPQDPAMAWAALGGAVPWRIDGCRARFRDDAGSEISVRFGVVAGAGLDARAVEQVSWAWKKRVGKLAYIVAAFQALLGHPDRVRCTLGGRPFSGRVVLAGNGRLYAGNIDVFRGGALDSGWMQVVGVERVTVRVLATCLRAYLTGRWRLRENGFTAAVTELRLESAGPDRVPLQLDGEFVGWLPATLTLLPAAMRVLKPRDGTGRRR